MIGALLIFLVGCLVLVVVIYVAKLVMAQLELPPPVAQIALLVIGLIGLLVLIALCYTAFQGGGPIVIGR